MVRGTVQGVGFRPFVHGLARSLDLRGFVGNDGAGVFIEVEGAPVALREFLSGLREQAPPLAVVTHVDVTAVPLAGAAGFTIVESQEGAARRVAVTPDAATCEACLREMRDPDDRRFAYPFVNCTHCGPRFTIVTDIPYDRSRTTMAAFEMCPACRREYEDPGDRRFHAQPVCCPACGPRLSLLDAAGGRVLGPAAGGQDVLGLLAEVAARLRAGQVLAVKGLGGYHLAADATDEAAVAALRHRKQREERPFAVMVADVTTAASWCTVTAADAQLLTSPAAPIVLLPRRSDTSLAPSVAPGQASYGLLLPYTPLHHLLLHAFGGPLVLTSGNVSDEPIAFRDDDALRRLASIADAFLVHDRPIHTRVDDSVIRSAPTGALPVRRSRGYTPSPLRLPWRFPRHVLGCGAELKSTFCLGTEDRAVLSHHIGDLENYETFTSYVEGIAHLTRLLDVHPEVLVHDTHPDYLSTAWAQEQPDVELLAVQHHHAHIASCLAENGHPGPVIGVAFDGTGYGADGTLWGGEFLLADLRDFRRAGHLTPVPLPGGSAAIRHPWRATAAYLSAASADDLADGLAVRQRHSAEWDAVTSLAASGLNTPLTSSAGRLFDAVAGLLGIRDTISYEGQAAIELELLAGDAGGAPWPLRVSTEKEGTHVVDGPGILRSAASEVRAGRAASAVAARFHATLAAATVEVCAAIRDRHGVASVALSGGCFQNVLLTRLCTTGLTDAGLDVLVHHVVPPNDGGISLGQATIAGARDRARSRS